MIDIDRMGKMQNPVCSICNTNFKKMEILNTHMKVMHSETDSMRMERLTITIECGVIFSTEKKLVRKMTVNVIKKFVTYL